MVRLALALCFLAPLAHAQDPECLQPIARFDTIDCPNGVCEVCTPREWEDGSPIQPGDLAGCILEVAGTPFQVSESDPAVLVPITIPNLCGPQPGTVWCTSVQGVESERDSGTLNLPACAPKKPKPLHFVVRG